MTIKIRITEKDLDHLRFGRGARIKLTLPRGCINETVILMNSGEETIITRDPEEGE